MTSQRERKLIRKLKNRQDKAAAEELIQHYYKDIYAYVFRQTGHKETAMDLTQEIFLGMLQGIGSYDLKRSGFRTWLYRIAVHKMTDYYRKYYRNGTKNITFSGELQIDTGENMETQAVNAELARQILLGLHKEDLLLEKLFQLKFYSEYTFSEIAEVLSLPESTVKNKYYTALKKLKTVYEKGI